MRFMTRNPYALEILGAEEVDYGGLIKKAGDLGSAAYGAYKASDEAKKASAADKAKLSACVAADKAAAHTMAVATGSGAGKDKTAADQALAACDAAAAQLPESQGSARVAVAQAALEAARAGAAASPKSTYAKNLVVAWEKILTKAQNAQFVSAETGGPPSSDESFLDKQLVGPVKVKHGLGAAALAAIGLVLRKVLRRKS